MSDKKTWFQTGEQGRKSSAQEDELAKTRRASGGSAAWRFFLKADESCKIVFLDTPNFFFHEHPLFKITGKNDNVTCLKDFDTCPGCEVNNPSYCVAATIIDTRESTGKDDKKYKNQKREYVAKGKARQIILRRAEEHKFNLRGCVFTVTRGSGTTECAVGEDIQFVKKLDEETLRKLCPKEVEFSEWSKPLDYAEIHKPLAVSAMRKLFGISAPVGSSDDSSDDDILGAESSTSDDIDNTGSIDDLV
jgi:hypothetical protein